MENEVKSSAVKCKKCGYLQHNSHLRCLSCKHTRFETVYPSGKCKLLTYTVLTAPPVEFRKNSFYALGIVEYENGVRALGQLSTQENLKTGMELKPVYAKICDDLDGKEIYNYIFTPD